MIENLNVVPASEFYSIDKVAEIADKLGITFGGNPYTLVSVTDILDYRLRQWVFPFYIPELNDLNIAHPNLYLNLEQ